MYNHKERRKKGGSEKTRAKKREKKTGKTPDGPEEKKITTARM